jgi:hypothetical protein
MRKNTMKRALQASAVVLAMSLVAATASAGDAAPKKIVKKTEVKVPVGGSGLVAGVDPVTGQLRQPTSAEFKKLADALKSQVFANATGTVAITEFADGTVSADLGQNFMNMSIVRINPDGSTSAACVDTIDEAINFFAAAPTPAFEDK